MSRALVNSAGVVVGACDEGLPLGFGRWEWVPDDAEAPRRPAIAADTNVEAVPRMQDLIRGYDRLK